MLPGTAGDDDEATLPSHFARNIFRMWFELVLLPGAGRRRMSGGDTMVALPSAFCTSLVACIAVCRDSSHCSVCKACASGGRLEFRENEEEIKAGI